MIGDVWGANAIYARSVLRSLATDPSPVLPSTVAATLAIAWLTAPEIRCMPIDRVGPDDLRALGRALGAWRARLFRHGERLFTYRENGRLLSDPPLARALLDKVDAVDALRDSVDLLLNAKHHPTVQ